MIVDLAGSFQSQVVPKKPLRSRWNIRGLLESLSKTHDSGFGLIAVFPTHNRASAKARVFLDALVSTEGASGIFCTE